MPIVLKLTAWQAHDGRSAQYMFDTVVEGDILLVDRASGPDALRVEIVARGAWATIRRAPNRKRRRLFSAFLSPYRNMVDRFFNRLGPSRPVTIRYDKQDGTFLASDPLASLCIWLRFNESNTLSSI